MATDFCRVGRNWTTAQPNHKSSRAACRNAIVYAESRLCEAHYQELIASKPETCRGCSLYQSGWGFSLGNGPENTGFMAIAEALGEEEAYSFDTLVGGSGRMWNAMLYHAGISRTRDVFATNVCKCRPPGNRKPDDSEMKYCAQYLIPQIQRMQPRCILLLGNTPLYFFHGTEQIGLYRGVPDVTKSGLKTLASYHPAFIARQQELWPIAVHDYMRAYKESKTEGLVRAPVQYDVTCTGASLGPDLLKRARHTGFFVFDFETDGLDPRTNTIKCCGFGTESYRAQCADWSRETHALLGELFLDPSIEVVGQNSEGFDIPVAYAKGVPRIRGRSFDTHLAFHLTNSDLPKNLATIATFYTDMKYWKGKETMYHAGYEALKYGCCQDVDATCRSYLGLRRELKEMNLEDLYYKSMMPLQPVLRRMQERGKRKDVAKAGLWATLLRRKIYEYTEILRSGIGDALFDVNSPKQVMDLLYTKMGLPIQYTRDRVKGMRPTADAKAIARLVEEFPNHKVLGLISEIRSAEHQISTNLEVETDENDFVHPVYDSRTAATGRLASRGPNDQNIPLLLREIYIPDDDEHVFYTRDWSQIEWRLAMVLSGDYEGLRRLTSGIDVHILNAADSLQKRVEDVTEDDRDAAKFIVYGLGYGRGADSIATTLRKDLFWVDNFIGNFFKGLPDYQAWRDDQTEFWKRNQCLINPFGRRRWWYTRKVTEFFNFGPQSTGADMLIKAMIMLDEQLPKGASIRLSTHDEIGACCHRDVARQTEECFADVMSGTKWPNIVEASRRPDIVKKFYPNGWSCESSGNFGTNWKMCKGKREDKAKCAALRKELGL